LNTGLEKNSGETILEVSFEYFVVYIFRRYHFKIFDRTKMAHRKSEMVRIEDSEPFEGSNTSSIFQIRTFEKSNAVKMRRDLKKENWNQDEALIDERTNWSTDSADLHRCPRRKPSE
jgi:hypothetical protein